MENEKPLIVVLTGAGVSAESGLATFRDGDGLWANHRIEDVCTPKAWRNNPQLVLDFYNQRRAQAMLAQPNLAHLALADWQKDFRVQIITQNVDDLHERVGSLNVLHLHGELNKARSTQDDDYIIECLGNQTLNDKDPNGYPMRPHIVWFGENVPLLNEAVVWAIEADAFVVVGTSLQVYPANTLLRYTQAPIFVIDPNPIETTNLGYPLADVKWIRENATVGVPKLHHDLLTYFQAA